MNYLKTFVQNVVSAANQISNTTPRMREVMATSSGIIARAYMNDIFRMADIITQATKSDPKEYIKLILPSSSQAIEQAISMIEKLDLKEAKQDANEAVKAAEAAQQMAEAAQQANVNTRPVEPTTFKLNAKAWTAHGQSMDR